MTLDELFEMPKKEYDVNTIEGYKKNYLKNLYLTIIREDIALKMSQINNEEFFHFLWESDDYKNSLINGHYVVKASVWQDDEKVLYIKNAINNYYQESDKQALLNKIEKVKLPSEEVNIVNNAPEKLNQEILKAKGDDKLLLTEVKDVIYQTLDESNQTYFLNIAKAYGSEQNNKINQNILKHQNDSNLTKAFVHNFFKSDKYQYETIGTLSCSYDEKKFLMDSFFNYQNTKNPKKEKLKQAAKLIYDKLYDGKPILGEEGNKVYSARKFYESFSKINELINSSDFDIEAIKKEYENYKKLKEEYIDVIKQVKEILVNTDAYAGNMDLARTDNMPKEFVENYQTVSAMNAIWIMIGRTKDFNMKLDDMIDNPYQIASNIIKSELELDYNKIFDKNNLMKTIEDVITYVPKASKDYMAISRFVTNCFMADDNDVGAKIFEKLFTAIYSDVMHSADFVDGDARDTITKLALFTSSKEDIDLNFFLSKNYFKLDTLTRIPNYDLIKEDKIFDLESRQHINMEELYKRFKNIKDIYDRNGFPLTSIPESLNRYINKYMHEFKASDFIMAAQTLNMANSISFNEKLPITSSIRTLSKICDKEQFPYLIKYAQENAFDEYPVGKSLIEKYINECYNKLNKDDNINQLYNEFLMKSEGEILFTAFENKELLDQQKNILESQYEQISSSQIDVPFIKEMALALFEGNTIEELKTFNRDLEDLYSFDRTNFSKYLQRYISYINKDIRSLSKPSDIRQALIIKNGYRSLVDISKNYPDFILNNYSSPEDKVKFNIMAKKLYASYNILNNQTDSYDMFKNYVTGKKDATWILKKEDGVIYGKDEALAIKRCNEFFKSAINMTSSFYDNLVLEQNGLNPECQIFVGGKSIEEIKNAKYSNMSYNDAKNKILLNALKRGKDPIELVVYNNEKPRVITLKIDYTMAKLNSNYYSRFRKFFSFIFKMRPNHTYQKALAKIDDKKAHDDNLIQKFNSTVLFANLKKKQSDLLDKKTLKKSITVSDVLNSSNKTIDKLDDSKKRENELKK